MSFINHIERCNRWDKSSFVPFLADGRQVGWFRRDMLHHVAAFSDILVITVDTLSLSPTLRGADERSHAMEVVARSLAGQGLTLKWRGEPYRIGSRFGETVFELERAAVPAFGVRAYGVHVNGMVRKDDGLHLWIPRRAADRVVAPGKLDNMVAGGQAAGHGVRETLIKEAAEEAAMPQAIAERAKPVGAITYRMEMERGLRNDGLLVFDLEVPEDFTPANNDGEVEDFTLLPVAEVMDIVENSNRFKFNCNLVLIDFFIRHGLIGPDHPDYLDLIAGLHG